MLLHPFSYYHLSSAVQCKHFLNFQYSHSPFQVKQFITYFIPAPNSPSFHFILFIYFLLFPFNPFYPPSFLLHFPLLNICHVWNCYTFLLSVHSHSSGLPLYLNHFYLLWACSLTLKMDAAHFSEKLITIYKTMWHHVTEDGNMYA